MSSTSLVRMVPALIVAVLLASACTRDPSPGTPAAAAEGERVMREMSDTLAKASAFSFATAESLELGDQSTRRVVQFTRTVTVHRPDAMSFELDGSGDTAMDVSAYYDGKTVSLRDNLHGMWAQTTVPGTLDEMLDDVARRYSLPVPIADVVYSVPYEAFIGPDSKGGFIGRESIDGVECSHLNYVDKFVDVHIWIPSSGQMLPQRVELIYMQAAGAPKARIDFTSWDLASQVGDGAFAFQPGGASTQVAFEQIVSSLLTGASPTGPAALAPSTAGTDH